MSEKALRNKNGELQTTIDYIIAVQKCKAKQHTSRVEAGALLGENVIVNVPHQIAAHCVFHDEKNVFRRLKARRQIDEKWMLMRGRNFEDALLNHERFDLFAHENVAFFEHFERVILAILSMLSHYNLKYAREYAFKRKEMFNAPCQNDRDRAPRRGERSRAYISDWRRRRMQRFFQLK